MNKEIKHKGRNGDLNGTGLVPGPLDAVDTSQTKVATSKSSESSGGEIEIGNSTTFAAIGKGNGHAPALECRSNSASAHGVVVRVNAIVARVLVKEKMRNRGNKLLVIVGNSAGAKTGSVKSTLSSLSTDHEGGEISTVSTRVRVGGFGRRGR